LRTSQQNSLTQPPCDAGCRRFFQPGGEVDRGPDAGEVEAVATADVAVKHRADMERQPEAKAFDGVAAFGISQFRHAWRGIRDRVENLTADLRGVAVISPPTGNNAQQTVAHEFQHFAAARVIASMKIAVEIIDHRSRRQSRGDGGEVLKFMGDGLLAVFPVAGDDGNAAEICGQVLDAVHECRASVAELTYSEGGHTVESFRFGLALHIGTVLYGNIGGGNRLDFTCIGPAVKPRRPAGKKSPAACIARWLRQRVLLRCAQREAGPISASFRSPGFPRFNGFMGCRTKRCCRHPEVLAVFGEPRRMERTQAASFETPRKSAAPQSL